MGLSYERRHAGLLGLHKRPSGEFSFVGLVRNIEVNTATASSVGAAVTDLHSFTLPANSLRNNEDYLIVDYGGAFAANDNDKRVLALFDGLTYEDGLAAPQDLDGGANNGWRFYNKIVRVSATSVRVHSLFAAQFIFMDSTGAVAAPGNAGFLHLNRSVLLTVSNLSLNSIIMKVQGQGVADGDVLQDMSIIEIVQN